MKHIFVSLLLLFPFVSFANDIASMSADNVIAIFDETLPFIEERMKKINPDLVDKMADAENMDKIYEYKNFMVHYVFDEKVQHYIDLLYKHCESAGCKISHKTFSDAVEGWKIEQPDKKLPECYKNGDIGNERICPYPKDYDWSTMELHHNFFQGFIDNMVDMHGYNMSIDDREGSLYLILYDTEWSHSDLIDYYNQQIFCNSEDRPYNQLYKNCIANNTPEQRGCQNEALSDYIFAEHEKCLKERTFPIKNVSGGTFREFKNW